MASVTQTLTGKRRGCCGPRLNSRETAVAISYLRGAVANSMCPTKEAAEIMRCDRRSARRVLNGYDSGMPLPWAQRIAYACGVPIERIRKTNKHLLGPALSGWLHEKDVTTAIRLAGDMASAIASRAAVVYHLKVVSKVETGWNGYPQQVVLDLHPDTSRVITLIIKKRFGGSQLGLFIKSQRGQIEGGNKLTPQVIDRLLKRTLKNAADRTARQRRRHLFRRSEDTGR